MVIVGMDSSTKMILTSLVQILTPHKTSKNLDIVRCCDELEKFVNSDEFDPTIVLQGMDYCSMFLTARYVNSDFNPIDGGAMKYFSAEISKIKERLKDGME